jgi:hypothetical protein
MTYDADGHAADHSPEAPALIEHFVRIYPFVLLLMMTFVADVPLLRVRPFSQKVGATCFVIIEMTRQAGDHAVNEGKRNRAVRRNIHRVVVLLVIIVAAQAIRVFIPGGSQIHLRRRLRQTIPSPRAEKKNSKHCRYDQSPSPLVHASPAILTTPQKVKILSIRHCDFNKLQGMPASVPHFFCGTDNISPSDRTTRMTQPGRASANEAKIRSASPQLASC